MENKSTLSEIETNEVMKIEKSMDNRLQVDIEKEGQYIKM